MEEVKVPSPGESISEVDLASWIVSDGDYVEIDEVIAEIDSDKATLELTAPASGTISLKVEEGDTVEVGAIVAEIDTSAEPPAGAPKEDKKVEDNSIKEASKLSDKKDELKEDNSSKHAEGHPSPSA